MASEDYESRIAALELRLANVEALLSKQTSTSPEPVTVSPRQPLPPLGSRADIRSASAARKPQAEASIGNILGWGGAIAFLLAAAYLIRLAIDSGWLTPMRQVALTALLGFALLGAGFLLRRDNRQYAGLLPATGIATLFLAIYGGHLYHHIIGVHEAGVAVIIVCIASLLLCRLFDSELYALFAVAGSYSAPFLLDNPDGSLTDLVVYFSAWGVVFCAFSLWQGRRRIYLLALYLALIGFDVIWQQQGSGDWMGALIFQAVQFLLFAATTAWFSVRREAPLDSGTAMLHFPPLLLFYFLQYSLLDQHLPHLAPWISVASLAVVAALYGIARASLDKPLPGGELLLWGYSALVLLHAGYIESVPQEWAPWVAFVLVPVVATISIRKDDGLGARWPIWVAVGIIFMANYLRIIFDTDVHQVPAQPLLAIAYALQLYIGYGFCRRQATFDRIKPLLLCMGHVCAMAAALHLVDEHIVESAIWGGLAITCMGLSLPLGDKLLRQSSLAIFAATAAKVMLYDLSGASPVARIVGLLVLGITFYFGGMLYQRLLGENRQQ
jgi:uncharacterized membrane protein